jgi:hypothetical protein
MVSTVPPRGTEDYFSFDGSELGLRNAENALNAIRVPHGNLDMSLFVEARAFVNRPAFDEDALDRVNRLIAAIAADSVNHLDHGAIQSPQ